MSPLATFSRQTSAHRSKTWCRYTFASSGDTTAPLRRAHLRLRPFPVFRYSRLQPLPDEPEHPIVGHSMLDELHRPFVVHVVEEPPTVRIEYPVHAFPLDARVQRVQRLMQAASWPKPVRKAPKVHLVYLIEDRDHRLLNDLVFQRGDAQWTLLPIGLRYVHSSRRLCPVRSTVHPALEILEPIFQAVFINAPCHAVYSRSRVPLQGVIAPP